jgi:hypothetical protein
MATALFLFLRSDKLCLYPGDVMPSILATYSYPPLTVVDFKTLLSDIHPDAFPKHLFDGLSIDDFDPRLRNSLLLGFSGIRHLSFLFNHSPKESMLDIMEEHILTSRVFYKMVKTKGFRNYNRPGNFIQEMGSVNTYCD